ncbi:Rap-GAP domain-containing protein [Smittium mucronatum]|uniref:Rap-GAP domain-containing protein n=1 Tax=Smittium mucronatum TaxID=133383 RepID=A0A1R0GVM1_9FUNG|nr:Rap-GAP domain-containing protein [Smittium mucronatum]
MLLGLLPLLKNENAKSDHFSTKAQFDWAHALLLQGLLLPIEFVNTISLSVDVYQMWLLKPELRPKFLEPEDIDGFLKKIIFELVLLFNPRPYSTTGAKSTDIKPPILVPQVEPEILVEPIVTNSKLKRGLLAIKSQIPKPDSKQPSITYPASQTEEVPNKQIYTPIEKYIDLLKQVLMIFTVLTRLNSNSKWRKTIIQSVVKCITGVADFCLKQGNEFEEVLELERIHRLSDPMWTGVGSSISELLMKNFFEVWFRTETVDDQMWNTLIHRIKFWTHRPQVVTDVSTASVSFTRRSCRVLYDNDPRVGTGSLVLELGLNFFPLCLPFNISYHYIYRVNRLIKLDLTDSYILFTWPRLLSLFS